MTSNSQRLAAIKRVLTAVAEGYPYTVEDHFGHGGGYLLVVENPDFKEDNGSDPNLVIQIDW